MFAFTTNGSLGIRKSAAFGRASYLIVIHRHMAALAEAAKDSAEFARQKRLEQTFTHLSEAYHSVDEKGTKGDATLAALEHYEYNLCKCKYKNILGHGRPHVENCSEYAFFMVDPLAREAMNRVLQTPQTPQTGVS